MAALIPLIPAFTEILDRFLPDHQAAEAAKLEMFKAVQQQNAEETKAAVAIAVAQAATNTVEAASNRLFVAGWRPFVGWICGTAFAFKYIGGPIAYVIGQLSGHPFELPVIETQELLVLLAGMLGLGTLRTVDKIKGVA